MRYPNRIILKTKTPAKGSYVSPSQSMSVAQILRRSAAGQPVSVASAGTVNYDGDRNLPFNFPTILPKADPTELAQYADELESIKQKLEFLADEQKQAKEEKKKKKELAPTPTTTTTEFDPAPSAE